MECSHCRGRMERGTAPLSMDREGYQIHWDAIPAWVCLQCGEPHFGAREVEAIQRILQRVDEETPGVEGTDARSLGERQAALAQGYPRE